MRTTTEDANEMWRVMVTTIYPTRRGYTSIYGPFTRRGDATTRANKCKRFLERDNMIGRRLAGQHGQEYVPATLEIRYQRGTISWEDVA